MANPARGLLNIQIHGYHREYSLCESEIEKVQDDRGNQLSVGKGNNGSTLQLSSWYFPLTAGIADDARIPNSEDMIIERHRALNVVVGDVMSRKIVSGIQGIGYQPGKTT